MVDVLLVLVKELLLERDESLVDEFVGFALEVARLLDIEVAVELVDDSLLGELELLVVPPMGLSGILEDDVAETDVEEAEIEVELLVKLVEKVLGREVVDEELMVLLEVVTVEEVREVEPPSGPTPLRPLVVDVE